MDSKRVSVIVTVRGKYSIAIPADKVNELVPLYDELVAYGKVAKELVHKMHNNHFLTVYREHQTKLNEYFGRFQFYINENNEIGQWAYFDNTEYTKLQLNYLIRKCNEFII